MTNIKIILILLIFVPGVWNQMNAQTGNWCATPYFDSIEIARDPDILKRRAVLEAYTQQFQPSDEKTVLTIPVVFHIVHNYGAENIPKSSVEAVIEQMNKDYRKLNMELSQVVSQFKPIVADVEVEFKLARLDPDGNCTEGITRTHSLSTYNADNNVKYEIPGWNPNKYLNIWVVNSIASGAAAWSHYPGVSPELDGVVCKYNYIGYNHVITHEVGHYLNLMHTWGDSNEPGLASNCNMDDNVGDTPNTMGTTDNSCNLSQATCGSLDNVQNYMDYSGCYIMFTEGQKTRMRAALNSWIGGRNNLWTNANLLATGTNPGYNPPVCSPIPDFKTDFACGCMGSSFAFTDMSYNGEVTSWEWSFPGGSPSFSNEQNPVINYINKGKFSATLTVYNSAGYQSITKNSWINVMDTLSGEITPMNQDMQSASFPDYPDNPERKWTIAGDAVNKFTRYTHSNGNISMRVNNANNYAGTFSELVSPNIMFNSAIDMSQLEFRIAYARRNANSTDIFKVFLSTNCGRSWLMRYIKSGSTLATNGGAFVTGTFIPTDNDWKSVKINTNITQPVNHVMIKFQITSNGGNYLYIDDIKIGKPATAADKISFEDDFNFYVHPNPLHDDASIELFMPAGDKITFYLFNLAGILVTRSEYSVKQGENHLSGNILFNGLKPGIYYLKGAAWQKTRIVKVILY